MATITGTAGNDSLTGSNGADTFNALAGDDTIVDGGGNDDVFAGEDNDIWVTSGVPALSDRDQVFLEGGDDTAQLGFTRVGGLGREELLDGGTGVDTFSLNGNTSNFALNATLDNSGTVTGNWISTVVNFENLEGGNAANILTGNAFDNVLDGLGGNDRLIGNEGNDTLNGGTGNDTLLGGDDNDLISAGTGTDSVDGGTGDDTILGGGQNDLLNGGADADTFILSFDGVTGILNTTVNGGSTGNDNDVLDISALIAEGFVVTSSVQNPETNGNPGFNGALTLFNASTGQTAVINYTDIENIICFVAGTMIRTKRGDVPVQKLRKGDRVQTADNGLSKVLWIGRRRVIGVDHHAPVHFEAGVLGNDAPLLLSPQHRVLVSSKIAQRVSGDSEVLVAAKHLIGTQGVAYEPYGFVDYFHILLEQHELILSNGAWAESLYTGAEALKSLSTAGRREIETLFPEVIASDLAARPLLQGRRGKELGLRHAKNTQPLVHYV